MRASAGPASPTVSLIHYYIIIPQNRAGLRFFATTQGPSIMICAFNSDPACVVCVIDCQQWCSTCAHQRQFVVFERLFLALAPARHGAAQACVPVASASCGMETEQLVTIFVQLPGRASSCSLGAVLSETVFDVTQRLLHTSYEILRLSKIAFQKFRKNTTFYIF